MFSELHLDSHISWLAEKLLDGGSGLRRWGINPPQRVSFAHCSLLGAGTSNSRPAPMGASREYSGRPKRCCDARLRVVIVLLRTAPALGWRGFFYPVSVWPQRREVLERQGKTNGMEAPELAVWIAELFDRALGWSW